MSSLAGSKPAIRVDRVGKAFRNYSSKWRRMGAAIFGSTNHHNDHWVLKDVTFELSRGATFGIIGQNGSGKTTLLQLLAGLLKPTEGEIKVEGKIATVLELDGGFQHDLTGRENVFISCGLRGFSRKNTETRIQNIIDFSELEDFIDHPIKHYSSGMLMRLAFATAINVEPDILLIDEVFAVGDMAFQHKCSRRFRELQTRGTTIVLATHDLTALKSLCHQAILLEGGRMIRSGQPEDVANCYLSIVAEKIAQSKKIIETKPQSKEALQDFKHVSRHGSGEARVISAEILLNEKSTESVSVSDDVTFRFGVEYFNDVEESILGFFIRDRYGNDLIGINTYEEGKPIGPKKKGDRIVIDFKLRIYMREGSYSVSPGLAYHPTEMRYLDWIDNAAVFQVLNTSNRRVHGFFWVPNEITIKKQEKG